MSNRRASKFKSKPSDLPSDIQIESSVVGSILKKPSLILHSEFLKQRMFYGKDLGVLYEIVFELYESGIDEIEDFTIIDKINESKTFKKNFDGYDHKQLRDYFSKLKLVGTNQVEEYLRRCKKVIELDFRRESYLTLQDMSDRVLSDEDSDINKINLDMQDDIMKLSEEYLLDTDVKIMADIIDEIREKIEIKNTKGVGAGFPSKFPIMKDFFSYEKGELVIVGGRAKSGKSMYFLNEVYHKLEAGIPCAIFDTEMPTTQWVERFLAHYTGMTVKEIKQKTYEDDEMAMDEINEAYEFLRNAPFAHIYDPSWTNEKIFTTAKILQRKIGLEILVFDYIKDTGNRDRNTQEHNHLGDMTNFLKNQVGGKLDISMIAGGQMSPKEERLADSDKINRYASVVMYWMRKTQEEIDADGMKAGNMKIFIDYNRLGKQMYEGEYINMTFNGDKATINQARKQNLDDDVNSFG